MVDDRRGKNQRERKEKGTVEEEVEVEGATSQIRVLDVTGPSSQTNSTTAQRPMNGLP